MIPLLRSTLPWLAVSVFVAGGCNLGRTVDKVTLKRLAPGMLAVGDVGLGCASGGALSPALIALGHRSDGKKEPKKAAALTLIAAGMCSERAAWEADLERARLRYMASNGGSPVLGTAMEDLTIKAQRFHREAAARNLAAYQRVVEVYGAPTEERACPSRLRERDEVLFLLGMTAGLLATLHDVQAERSVGVSQSIPNRVVEGAACLDNERWWGLPAALESAVAGSLSGAVTPSVDPWIGLRAAAAKGEASGLWLGRALQLQTAYSAGRTDDMWAAIEAHGAALGRSAAAGDDDAGAANPEYALLNAYASEMIEFRSDVLWIGATGHRTPLGQLGTRPPEEVPEGELTELFDGLGGDDDGDAPPVDAPPADGDGPAAEAGEPPSQPSETPPGAVSPTSTPTPTANNSAMTNN
jgi:hypothetical protein